MTHRRDTNKSWWLKSSHSRPSAFITSQNSQKILIHFYMTSPFFTIFLFFLCASKKYIDNPSSCFHHEISQISLLFFISPPDGNFLSTYQLFLYVDWVKTQTITLKVKRMREWEVMNRWPETMWQVWMERKKVFFDNFFHSLSMSVVSGLKRVKRKNYLKKQSKLHNLIFNLKIRYRKNLESK